MQSRRAATILVLVGGGLAIMGAILPWASATAPLIGTVNAAGTEGDGKLTLALGVLVVVLGIVGLTDRRPLSWWLAGIAGAVVVWAGVYDATNASARIADAEGVSKGLLTASVGIGLWITIAAGANDCDRRSALIRDEESFLRRRRPRGRRLARVPFLQGGHAKGRERLPALPKGVSCLGITGRSVVGEG